MCPYIKRILKSLSKKVAALSDSISMLHNPSSDHNSICMEALIHLKNSLKADLIDIKNYTNDFDDAMQRQNDKIQSLSEVTKKQKQEISESKSDKKIAELQKKVSLSSSSSESTCHTPPTNNFDTAAVAVSSDYFSSSSSSSTKHKPAQKSSFKSTHKATHEP